MRTTIDATAKKTPGVPGEWLHYTGFSFGIAPAGWVAKLPVGMGRAVLGQFDKPASGVTEDSNLSLAHLRKRKRSHQGSHFD
ncbi:MAG TPA: hypothetical protein VF254_00495 [Gammaproteobacteria bacterium]